MARKVRAGYPISLEPLESKVENSHDKSFFGTFMLVLGVLFAFLFAIIFLADMIGGGTDADPVALAKAVDERTAPVGKVITDPSLLVKVSAKAEHAPLTGDQVVAQVCSACHGSGVLNAPKLGDKGAWSARKSAAGGVDGLLKSALNGKNQMPARGGNPDLTDGEIKAAIEAMLKQTGV
jgi:cytochrome c5